MFGNFLFFIVALLIYATYQPPAAPNFAPLQALLLLICMLALFAAGTWIQFRYLRRRFLRSVLVRADHKYDALLLRQCLMAIAFFAVEVYGLSLPAYLSGLPPFQWFPTLEALLFLAFFIAHLDLLGPFAGVGVPRHAPRAPRKRQCARDSHRFPSDVHHCIS